VKWSIRNNINLQQSGILLAMNYVANNKEKFLTGHYSRLETNDTQSQWIGVAEITGSWKYTETFMENVDKVTVNDLNTVFNKYSNSINWTYLGKESAVTKEDFKQPQMLPANNKLKGKN